MLAYMVPVCQKISEAPDTIGYNSLKFLTVSSSGGYYKCFATFSDCLVHIKPF